MREVLQFLSTNQRKCCQGAELCGHSDNCCKQAITLIAPERAAAPTMSAMGMFQQMTAWGEQGTYLRGQCRALREASRRFKLHCGSRSQIALASFLLGACKVLDEIAGVNLTALYGERATAEHAEEMIEV
jgi:hypothetical protein